MDIRGRQNHRPGAIEPSDLDINLGGMHRHGHSQVWHHERCRESTPGNANSDLRLCFYRSCASCLHPCLCPTLKILWGGSSHAREPRVCFIYHPAGKISCSPPTLSNFISLHLTSSHFMPPCSHTDSQWAIHYNKCQSGWIVLESGIRHMIILCLMILILIRDPENRSTDFCSSSSSSPAFSPGCLFWLLSSRIQAATSTNRIGAVTLAIHIPLPSGLLSPFTLAPFIYYLPIP